MLTEYLASHNSKRFDWADNNCVGFVSGALEAQGYDPLPSEWYEGYITSGGALRRYRRLLRDLQHKSIVHALDARYDRVMTLHPEDGLIAARPSESVMGYVLGVTFKGDPVYLLEDGLVRLPIDATDILWCPT